MSVHPRPVEPTHHLPGAAFTSLATPTTGSSDTAVWEVRLTPGHSGVAHRLTRQEVFIVLSGKGTAHLAGTSIDLAAGDTLVVPAQTSFLLEAAGAEHFVALCCLPVGGQAIMGDLAPFTPPWAE